MENDQAQEATQTMDVAPQAGVEPMRERVKTSLLDQMTGSMAEAGGEETARIGTDQAANEGSVEAEEPGEAEAGGANAPAEDNGTGESETGTQDDERKKGKNFRGRWDHLDEQEKRVVELTTKRGLTLAEAYRAVYGTEGTPMETGTFTDRAASAGQPDAVTELSERIARQEQRVEELKRQKAGANGDISKYDEASEACLEAREQLRELRIQKEEAERQRDAAAADARTRAEAVAQAAVAEEYPDALTPGTELYEACAEEVAYLRQAKSPLVDDPQLQYKIARRMARALGYEALNIMNKKSDQKMDCPPATRAGGLENVSQPAAKSGVAPKRSVRPVPAGGSPVETPVSTLQRRVSEARSSDSMLALMREIGTPFEALLKK